MTKKEIKKLIRENEKLSKKNTELQEYIKRVERTNLWLAESLDYIDRAIKHPSYVRGINRF